jgi:hypothetical protein
MVISGNGGIRAVSLCFGCHRIDEEPAEYSANDRNDEKEPGPKLCKRFAK